MNNGQKLVLEALKYYGISETINGKLNPKIDEMLDLFRIVSIDTNWDWCGSFIGKLLADICYDEPGSLVARHYLGIGLKTDKPVLGDLVIFWREDINSWKGHVGIFINFEGSGVNVLGGNQNHTVNVKRYDLRKVLGYRRV